MAKVKIVGEVIVLEEKHGTILLDASTEKAKHKAALSVIVARFGGPKPQFPLHDPVKPVVPSIPETDIPTIGNKDLKRGVEDAWERYKRNMQHYAREKDQVDTIRECIQKKDGKAALMILQWRAHFEYEGFYTDVIHDVYPMG